MLLTCVVSLVWCNSVCLLYPVLIRCMTSFMCILPYPQKARCLFWGTPHPITTKTGIFSHSVSLKLVDLIQDTTFILVSQKQGEKTRRYAKHNSIYMTISHLNISGARRSHINFAGKCFPHAFRSAMNRYSLQHHVKKKENYHIQSDD